MKNNVFSVKYLFFDEIFEKNSSDKLLEDHIVWINQPHLKSIMEICWFSKEADLTAWMSLYQNYLDISR